MSKRVFKVCIILILAFFIMGCNPYVKSIKDLGIGHVFKNPNQAYGPVSLLMYTAKTDYEITCKPWEVLGIDQDSYDKDELIKFQAADHNVSENTSIELKINLSEKELASLNPDYKNITEVKVEVTNGQMVVPKRDYASIIEKVIDPKGNCRKAYIYKRILNPNARFYLVCTAYSYDFKTNIKIDDKWVVSTDLPEELLKIISAKIEVQYSHELEKTMSGKGLYVGFNGDSITPKTIKELMEAGTQKTNLTGSRNSTQQLIDITEIMNNL